LADTDLAPQKYCLPTRSNEILFSFFSYNPE
jgi:hypothetical protein